MSCDCNDLALRSQQPRIANRMAPRRLDAPCRSPNVRGLAGCRSLEITAVSSRLATWRRGGLPMRRPDLALRARGQNCAAPHDHNRRAGQFCPSYKIRRGIGARRGQRRQYRGTISRVGRQYQASIHAATCWAGLCGACAAEGTPQEMAQRYVACRRESKSRMRIGSEGADED